MAFLLQPDTKVDRVKAAKGQRGAPSKRLAGGWIGDLTALGKAVVLCDGCRRKFDAKRAGYERRQLWPGQKFVLGDCDGCGRWCQGVLHVKQGSTK